MNIVVQLTFLVFWDSRPPLFRLNTAKTHTHFHRISTKMFDLAWTRKFKFSKNVPLHWRLLLLKNGVSKTALEGASLNKLSKQKCEERVWFHLTYFFHSGVQCDILIQFWTWHESPSFALMRRTDVSTMLKTDATGRIATSSLKRKQCPS